MLAIILTVAVLEVAAATVPAPVPPDAGKGMPIGVYTLDPASPSAEAICESFGGSVVVMSGGAKMCALPKGCKAWSWPQLLTTTILRPDTAKARKECTDQCGQLSTNPAGQVFCSKVRVNTTRGWLPREPTH
jgi:hypothetical protein